MTEIFRLVGKVAVDTYDANNALDDTTGKAQSAGTKISNALKKVGSAVVAYLSVRAIKDFGLACIEASANAQALASQFSQVFGEIEATASDSLSDIADKTGIAENRLKNSFTQIAAFAKTTGLETADALALSERAINAVADSAAFYDRSLETVTESLQSFLKGNFENDAALGLACTEVTRNTAANKLYGKSFIELSEAQKQLTLLQMVEDANAASGALGQAARESDTWTNQTGNLKQAIEDLKATVGDAFLAPAITAVKSLSEAIAKCSEFMRENNGTIEAIITTAGIAITTFAAFKAGMMLQSVVQSFQKAKIALSLLTMQVGAANLAQEVLNGTLTIGETIVALLTGKITLATAAQSLMTKAQAALNAVLSANPIGLVVAAIAALVAIGVTLYKNWDVVKAKCLELYANLKETFGKIAEVVTNVWNGIWEAVKGVINNMLGGVENWVNSIIRSINFLLSGVSKVASFLNKNWSIPSIGMVSLPRLEEGGILEKGQVGFLEGNGAEAVVPLDQNRKWISAVAADLNFATSGNNKEIQELKELFREFVDALPDMMIDAFATMKFDVNNREFARLVKAVN